MKGRKRKIKKSSHSEETKTREKNKEGGKYEEVLKRHEKQLWKSWFKKKTDIKEHIIFDYYRPWAEQLYSQTIYRSRDDSYLEEFLPTVYLALVKAIRDFRRNRGAAFKTFATKYIRIELFNAWRPFFKEGRQRPGTFNFVGDMLSDENVVIRDLHSYTEVAGRRLIIEETVERLQLAITSWGYTKKEWKIFYYRTFEFMPVKEIEKKTKFPEWKVMIILNHIKKDILSEFGEEYKQLIKGKYGD